MFPEFNPGITSAGFGCAVEKQPGIYHKVSTTSRWIAHQIRGGATKSPGSVGSVNGIGNGIGKTVS